MISNILGYYKTSFIPQVRAMLCIDGDGGHSHTHSWQGENIVNREHSYQLAFTNTTFSISIYLAAPEWVLDIDLL